MHTKIILYGFFFLLLSSMFTMSAAGGVDEVELNNLKSQDGDVRVEALRALQTSLDPRIPEALLKLLTDEGNSIRRLAARGVGSRWWQIPKERIPLFVSALSKNAKRAHNADGDLDDELSMIRRGIGLLTHDYTGPMFARSPNKRWVIYERRGFPCLIDTQSGSEELLGWTKDDDLNHWGNEELKSEVKWQNAKETAAIAIPVGRKDSAIWIWSHQKGFRKLEAPEVELADGYRKKDIGDSAGFFVTLKGWNENELVFKATFSTVKNDNFVDHDVTMAWDADKNSLRLISR